MRFLSPKVHGILDYVVVLVFLAAPNVLLLSGVPTMISYALAGIHLLLTLFTDFPLGVVKIISFRIHGLIEFVVGPVLVVLPWLAGFSQSAPARGFYIGAGIVIFLTWLITDYQSA